MKNILFFLLLITFFSCNQNDLNNGTDNSDVPFNYKDSPLIKEWADSYITPIKYGTDLDEQWKSPEKALGKASGSVYDIVSLGNGGEITLTFNKTIYNGSSFDFTIFENGFDDNYIELAFVEVSSNGTDFVRFDTETLIDTTVDSYGTMDSSKLSGFAGLHRAGYGTSFDLELLKDKSEVIDKKVDINNINFIKIIDIIGDGSQKDSQNSLIYDPYPVTGSSGFDLEAVGVYNCR